MTSHPAPATSIEPAHTDWLPRHRWLLAAGALVLLLILLALAAATGGVDIGHPGELWHLLLQPAVIVYLLVAFPWLQGRWRLAMGSLQALGVPAERIEAARAVNPRGEWLALLAGALVSLPITGTFPPGARWLTVYHYVANLLMFALMVQAIFDGGSRTRGLARLVNADLQLDLFDRQALMPLARWGQMVTLTFVGGTCLSLLFQSHHSLFTLTSAWIYSVMILVSLGLFFSSTWSLHMALSAARDRELADVRLRLRAARAALKQQLVLQPGPEAAEAYRPVVMLGLYEKQVLEASTWPFNPKIAKELAASVAAPVLIYGARFAFGLSGSP